MSEPISLSSLFNPSPKQRQFLVALKLYTFVLFGGAAGAGKSFILRWSLIALLLNWAKQGHRGVRVGLFCENYPALHDRQISKIAVEFPRWLGTFHAQTHEFRLHERFGGGVLCFRNLDDPSKYQSAEFAAIGVDELTKNQPNTFHFLRSRLRWPGITDTRFLAASNPGGPGHNFVKRFWIDRDFPPELKPFADQFHFVPAKASDNPHLAPGYYESLKSLPEEMARAFAEGDWNIFSGQVFTEFRREIHVCKPFPIPSHWERWGSNDPGFADPGVWYWTCADQDGMIYIYREATFDNHITYSEQAKQVAALTGSEEVAFIVTGMDAFNAHPQSGKRIIDYYREGGLSGFRQPVHGKGARAAMAATYHEYLRTVAGPDGKPTSRLKIFDTCTRLIQTLPTLPADEANREQVADCSIDHWYQAAGYGLQARHASHSSAPPAGGYPPGSLPELLGHREFLESLTRSPDDDD